MKRILIVEDDAKVVSVVRRALMRDGFQVVSASDGMTGMATIRRSPPDMVILDIELPKMSGLDICREIRRDDRLQRLPILLLTGRGEETDRVLGLELGADDYLVKPFSVRELTARVMAVLRRVSPPEGNAQAISVADFLIDPSAMRVTRDGRPVPLTVLEFRLLHYLATRPSRVFSREQLLDAVWGTDRFVTPRSIDVYMQRLREKLEDNPNQPAYLKTVRGAGYMFEVPES